MNITTLRPQLPQAVWLLGATRRCRGIPEKLSLPVCGSAFTGSVKCCFAYCPADSGRYEFRILTPLSRSLKLEEGQTQNGDGEEEERKKTQKLKSKQNPEINALTNTHSCNQSAVPLIFHFSSSLQLRHLIYALTMSGFGCARMHQSGCRPPQSITARKRTGIKQPWSDQTDRSNFHHRPLHMTNGSAWAARLHLGSIFHPVPPRLCVTDVT